MTDKADDWQAMKDERDAAKCGYANLLADTNGEIAGLRAQLAAASARAEGAMAFVRDVAEFNSGDDTTLGALRRLAQIRARALALITEGEGRGGD